MRRVAAAQAREHAHDVVPPAATNDAGVGRVVVGGAGLVRDSAARRAARRSSRARRAASRWRGSRPAAGAPARRAGGRAWRPAAWRWPVPARVRAGLRLSSSHSRRTVSQAVMWMWPTPAPSALRQPPRGVVSLSCSVARPQAAKMALSTLSRAGASSPTRCSSATQSSVASLSLTMIMGSSAAGQPHRAAVHRQAHAHGDHQLEQRGRIGCDEAVSRRTAGQRRSASSPGPTSRRPAARRRTRGARSAGRHRSAHCARRRRRCRSRPPALAGVRARTARWPSAAAAGRLKSATARSMLGKTATGRATAPGVGRGCRSPGHARPRSAPAPSGRGLHSCVHHMARHLPPVRFTQHRHLDPAARPRPRGQRV